MGKRGPPPKPPEQKRLEGTYTASRDAARESAMKVPPGAPPAPEELSDTAATIWNQVVPELLKLGTLAATDGGVLAGYCMTFARARELEKLAADQPMIKTPYGKKLNPAGVEARKLWSVVQKLAVDLGLSYAARSRTPPPKKADEQDPDEDFLFGKPRVIQGGKSD